WSAATAAPTCSPWPGTAACASARWRPAANTATWWRSATAWAPTSAWWRAAPASWATATWCAWSRTPRPPTPRTPPRRLPPPARPTGATANELLRLVHPPAAAGDPRLHPADGRGAPGLQPPGGLAVPRPDGAGGQRDRGPAGRQPQHPGEPGHAQGGGRHGQHRRAAQHGLDRQ